MNQVHTVSRTIGVCREYRLTVAPTLVNYMKAFDSVETIAILSVFIGQGVDSSYVRTLADCYVVRKRTIQLIALQRIMKSLDWDENCVHEDGRFSSNICSADDIVLSTNSTAEAEAMPTQALQQEQEEITTAS